MEPTANTIGAIVQAITARYDAAAATGEWPDRPHWQQPLAAPPPGTSRASWPGAAVLRNVTDSTHCQQ